MCGVVMIALLTVITAATLLVHMATRSLIVHTTQFLYLLYLILHLIIHIRTQININFYSNIL